MLKKRIVIATLITVCAVLAGYLIPLQYTTGCQISPKMEVDRSTSERTKASPISLSLPTLPKDSKPITIKTFENITLLDSLRILDSSIQRLAYSPDGDKLAVILYSRKEGLYKLYVLSSEMVDESMSLGSTERIITSLAWGSKQILAYNANETVEIWDVGSGILLCQIEVSPNYVKHLTFSPDGQLLAISSNDKNLYLVRLSDGKIIHQLKHGRGVFNSSFSLDGKWIATSSTNLTYQLWRVEDGHQIWQKQDRGNDMGVTFSPDGQLLIVGENPTRFVDPLTGETLTETYEMLPMVHPIVFTKSGDMFIGSGSDGVTFWNVQNHQLLRRITFPQKSGRVDLSPDGRFLAVEFFAVSNEIQFWGINE